MGGGGSETEDLAAWLRDVGGEGIATTPYDRSIDASWLGAAPSGDEARRSSAGGVGPEPALSP